MENQETRDQRVKLSVLDKRLQAFLLGYRQNIALIGDDPQEISWLLEKQLPQVSAPGINLIHLNADCLSAKAFIQQAAYAVLTAQTNSPRADIDEAINAAVGLDSTIKTIKDALRKDTPEFDDFLKILTASTSENKGPYLLVIEEFTKLAELFRASLREFAKFIMLERTCMVILTSCESQTAETTLNNELNLLFGNFEMINCANMSLADKYLYLKNLLHPVQGSPFLLSFLVNLLGSNSLYYDIIAHDIKNAAGIGPCDEEGILTRALTIAAYERRSYIFQRFYDRSERLKNLPKDRQLSIRLLAAASDGYLRKNELVSLGICDMRALDARLARLTIEGILENHGCIYQIKDPFYSFWLAHVYRFYALQPVCDPSRRLALWESRLKREMSRLKEEFAKDKTLRIIELISSFKDDTLAIGKNRLRLPQVERTRLESCPEKGFSFLIGEGKEIIFAGVKESPTDDSDVAAFIERGNCLKSKGVRKFFISLDKISHGAGLMAKNNRLAVWDIEQVNRILRLYNKPIMYETAGQP